MPSLRLQRIDQTLPLPRYETAGSIGFDLLARVDTEIPAGGLGFVPVNLIVEVPEGHVLILASRSSTPKKKGLSVPHGIGVIDHDYCGPEDELKVQVYNFTDASVTVARGEKIAQGLLVRADRFEFEEVSELRSESRGGFGSTG